MKTTDKFTSYLVLHPDGHPIFRCDEKKAKWYLKKSLAKQVNVENDLCIQLNFIPKGKGNVNDAYLMLKKDNICVCCGVNKDLTKHHIVPYRYRKYFPDEIKDHDCHDIVFLCSICHSKYETFALDLNLYFQRKYSISFRVDEKIIRIKKIAKTLSNNKINLPDLVKKEKMKIISEYLGYIPDDKDILRVKEEMTNIENLYKKNLFKKIIESVDSIQEFIETWRSHFIDVMKPMYLPDLWSIKRKKL